jgi:hypothetical protein
VIEQEWLDATDPLPMLAFLRGKASDRKLRLFAVACCRRICRYLGDPRSWEAIDRAEQYADRIVSPDKLQEAAAAAWAATTPLQESAFHAAKAVAWATDADAELAATEAADAAISATVCDPHDPEEDHLYQTAALRCCFGNPSRPVVADLAWRTSTVVAIAEGIYADRAFDRLPILADALMDAGCQNEDILNHLRSEGPHVRGCWVVDLLLRKE